MKATSIKLIKNNETVGLAHGISYNISIDYPHQELLRGTNEWPGFGIASVSGKFSYLYLLPNFEEEAQFDKLIISFEDEEKMVKETIFKDICFTEIGKNGEISWAGRKDLKQRRNKEK